MPTFTLRLKEVYEFCDGDLGLDDYPIWDESYRDHLNTLIIDNFWYREIAHETIDIFIWRLNVKMRTIMPRYNKMYSALAKLETEDLSLTGTQHSESLGSSQSDTTQSEENSAESASEQGSTTEGKSRAVTMEHPQVRLDGREDYATGSTDSASENTTGATSSSSQSAKGSGESSATGYTSSVTDAEQHQGPMAVFQQYWDTITNIDQLVLDELEPLFMGVWAVNDAYTGFEDNRRYDRMAWYMYGPWGFFRR